MITSPHCQGRQGDLLAQRPTRHVLSTPFWVNLMLDAPWTISIHSDEDPRGLHLTCLDCGGLLALPMRVVERPRPFSIWRQIEIYPSEEALMEALL